MFFRNLKFEKETEIESFNLLLFFFFELIVTIHDDRNVPQRVF